MKLYVSGPMTGYPDLNYPLFELAAGELRKAGFEVFNPAENEEQDSWEAYLRIDLAMVLAADGVAVLPNWQESRGARLEVDVAHALHIPVLPVARWLDQPPASQQIAVPDEAKPALVREAMRIECTDCRETALAQLGSPS